MSTKLPPQAYAAAVAAMPLMSLHRLSALLRHHPPEEAYAVVAGRHPPSGLIERVLLVPEVRAFWERTATAAFVDDVWRRCHQLALTISVFGDELYPQRLLDDPAPPPVLFAAGQLPRGHRRHPQRHGSRPRHRRPPGTRPC
jgi:predicted Rossmann fold nucleotide-binding protein DprA/Smf involved in DNA uptake